MSSPITPRMRLHERYLLVELLGTGGMSQVWRATDEVLGRPVAVKVLSAELAADPALREATWQEARAAAHLTHPHLTRVYDYGQAPLPDGTHVPYLVMELVEGETLAERLAGGALGWHSAARVGAQVAAGLAAAHRAGVVHHDIKPGNVMLTTDGAKVLDFGIAALVGAADRQVLVGTPTYTAPERVSGAPAHPANDIYSLGVLLYECLAGQPPARMADWSQAAAAHRDGAPPAPALDRAGLPPEVATLVRSCLSPDPAQRPPAERVAAALAGAAGIPDPAGVPAAGERTMVAPSRYAVGSAAPPPAPPVTAESPAPEHTRVDHRTAPEPLSRGRGRLVLASVVVGAVVLGLTLALANAALQGPDGPAGGAASSPATGTGPEDAGRATGPPDSSAPAGPLASAGTVVADLETVLRNAVDRGQLDPDAADDLWAEVQELRKELDKEQPPGERLQKIRESARDLRDEIDDLREDREISPELAAALRERIRPLLRGEG